MNNQEMIALEIGILYMQMAARLMGILIQNNIEFASKVEDITIGISSCQNKMSIWNEVLK